MWFWLFLGTVIGPMMDPVEGAQLSQKDYLLFPSGRHLGWIGDHLFIQNVDMQIGDAGLSYFDRLYQSAHGRSSQQMHTLLNGLQVDDPMRSGHPLFEPPQWFWDDLTYRSTWTSLPGFSWTIQPKLDNSQQRLQITAGYGQPLDDRLWLPPHLFDRQNALDFGASKSKRRLKEAELLVAEAAIAPWGRLFFERQSDNHRYPTYIENGEEKDGLAVRTTVMSTALARLAGCTLSLVVGWQGMQRDEAGAAYRWPLQNTGNLLGQSYLGQLHAKVSLPEPWYLKGSFLALYGSDVFTRRGASTSTIAKDILEEWQWQQRPMFSEKRQRGRLEMLWQAGRYFENWMRLAGDMRLQVTPMRSQMLESSRQIVNTLSLHQGADAGVSVLQLADQPPTESFMVSGLWRLFFEGHFGDHHPQALLGFDVQNIGYPHHSGFWQMAPLLGAAWRWRRADGQLTVLLRREPDTFHAGLGRFLDPHMDNAREYRFFDNNQNGQFDQAEQGPLLRRSGGLAHGLADSLKRPSSNHFTIAYKTPRFGPFRFNVLGTGRFHLDRLTIRYDEATQKTFNKVPLIESALSGGSQDDPRHGFYPSSLYARDLHKAGQERYLLVNDAAVNRFLGVELQLVTDHNSFWFMNLAGSAYESSGPAAFGFFADRNDPGILDESSADLNLQINATGRYDQDRAYVLKWLLGLQPLEDLSLGIVGRFRDGEPFSRLASYEQLPQGPIALALYPRGEVRYTFHLSVDTRIRYVWRIPQSGGLRLTSQFDVYNLFGFATELLEDPRGAANYRRSLETVPARSFFLSFALGWDG